LESEAIKELQAYGYLFMIIFLTVGLYAYIHHLYKTQKDGKVDYERYSDLALKDDIDSIPIEKHIKKDKKRGRST
jgi:cytochrome c oxidase cbb3-type subunit 4